MNNMNQFKLKNEVDYIKGFAFSSKDFISDDSQPMVVRVSDFTLDSITKDEAVFIRQSDKYEKYKLHKGDILIQTVGSWANNPNSIVGKIVRVPTECENSYLNQNIVKIISRGIDSTYLYYCLKANKFPIYCVMRGQGAANQASITLDTIFRFKFYAHKNREIQKRISNILSAYDDLIENNNKRIRLLEQMAENLYKEWFVRFRFSGYETAEFENGIPKGWEYVKFEDILSFDRGISYSSEEIDCDDGLNLINLKNIDSFGGFRRDGTKKYNGKYKESQVVKKGDLVIGVTDMTQDRRTVGAAALIPTIEGTSVISADLVKVVSDIPNIYLYCLFRYGFYSKYFSQFANGANVLHLKPSALLNKKVLLPTKDSIDAFVEKASAIIELIDELNLANDNLIKQRDLLLPRLMSGKLEV